jgi:hypothetical protein
LTPWSMRCGAVPPVNAGVNPPAAEPLVGA